MIQTDFWKEKLVGNDVYQQLVNEVFLPIITGEQLRVVVGLPGSGRSTLLRQLSYHPEIIGEEFKKRMSELVWVVINLPAEMELSRWWDESPWTQGGSGLAAEQIRGVIEKGKRVVWVVNSLDTVARSEKTRSLWNEIMRCNYLYPNKISWILGQGCEDVENNREILRELFGYYQKSQFYLPMLEDKSVAGGYWPLMARLKEKEVGIEDEVIGYSLEILWESCGEKSQQQLLDLMRGKSSNFNDYLAKTGVVEMEDSRWKLFSPLFGEWLKKMVGGKRPEIQEREEKLWLGESDLSEELSYQEYEVLKLLWQKRGEIVVRNEVAEVLWPKDTEDKYSDWAIDQVISKIRRKIGDLGENRLIKTIKGKGMMLEK